MPTSIQLCSNRLYALLITLLIYACGPRPGSESANDLPLANTHESEMPKAQFVGTEVCKSCHERAFEEWKGSHHDQAMKVADTSTVLGDFNNASFNSNGVKSRFFKKEDGYYVNTVGHDGQAHDYKIVYTFGIYPLQQYIVAFPDGAYQCLQTAWDTQKKQWFDLQPNLKIAHDEWLHWTGNAMRWNTACADCHSTDLRKNLDVASGVYKTSFKEINVGCEGCHGPGSNHAQFYQEGTTGTPPPLYMHRNMPSKMMVQKCARCHSRRSQLTPYFDYEGHFLDHYDPSVIQSPTYETDGQILDEDYVYGSFVQSKMYANGVACRDCHNVHSLKLLKTGNALCLDCHEKKYDLPEHHFHQIGTQAAQCINCHMTGRTYMGNDFRRDHSFRVPRPDQSVKYGTPNACTGCHTDKSDQWAADFIKDKFGAERPPHFSDALLEGYHGDREQLYALVANEDYPEIARATAMHYLGEQLAPDEAQRIRKYLQDPAAMVRNETVKAYDNLGTPQFVPQITPLLKDSVRLVRLAAVRHLSLQAPNAQHGTAFEQAHQEYLNFLDMSADFPSGQHQLAQYYEAQGKTDKAIAAYRKALEIDNYYNQARMNLALLLFQQGQPKAAEALYLKVVSQEPDASYPYYMLGLLYNEMADAQNAQKYLGLACEKSPPIFRACYNYALILQKNGQYKQSLVVLENALKKYPNNEQLLYVKLVGLLNSGQPQPQKAIQVCKQLIAIAPNNADYQNLLAKLQSEQQP